MQSLTHTHAHTSLCNTVMAVGGRGESKQGQISSDSEGRQLHILISLHFLFLLFNFYLIWRTSSPNIPSPSPFSLVFVLTLRASAYQSTLHGQKRKTHFEMLSPDPEDETSKHGNRTLF